MLVRLEDDEYRAQLQQARGQLANLQARLAELENGSRPEEIAAAKANVEQAQGRPRERPRHLDRTQQARRRRASFRSRNSTTPRPSTTRAGRARQLPAEGSMNSSKSAPARKSIDAVQRPDRAGEGHRRLRRNPAHQHGHQGAGHRHDPRARRRDAASSSPPVSSAIAAPKGYVVSLADLNDLQVELDINQNDFDKLHAEQKGVVTMDAYPDNKYDGVIDEISPEANRQKATVQVKVKILNPDELPAARNERQRRVRLRRRSRRRRAATPAKPVVFVPSVDRPRRQGLRRARRQGVEQHRQDLGRHTRKGCAWRTD